MWTYEPVLPQDAALRKELLGAPQSRGDGSDAGTADERARQELPPRGLDGRQVEPVARMA
jgi:hypothetical protein